MPEDRVGVRRPFAGREAATVRELYTDDKHWLQVGADMMGWRVCRVL
ncbi:MAG: hypothetical protein GDA36_07990 [Rhodobacteraceae bacterium]|nr:hypothetical protein [Paracoccaceae bacterium]